MKDLFGHLRRRDPWILAAGATVVVVCAIAIGLNGARSENPIPADKQAFQDREAASHEAAVALASEHPELLPPRNPSLILPTVQPTSWSIGIVPKVVPPFSGAVFTVKSGWQWDLDGNHVQVYAGQEGDLLKDPGRGILVVDVMSMSLQPIGGLSGSYEAPLGVGSLEIVSANGSLLTIQAATGQTFYFDAESRAFTDANGSPVPTDTPTPNPSPQPGGTLPIPFPFPTDATPTASAVPSNTVIASLLTVAGG